MESVRYVPPDVATALRRLFDSARDRAIAEGAWSQERIAQHVGVSRGALNRTLNGKARDIDGDKALEIAGLLKSPRQERDDLLIAFAVSKSRSNELRDFWGTIIDSILELPIDQARSILLRASKSYAKAQGWPYP